MTGVSGRMGEAVKTRCSKTTDLSLGKKRTTFKNFDSARAGKRMLRELRGKTRVKPAGIFEQLYLPKVF